MNTVIKSTLANVLLLAALILVFVGLYLLTGGAIDVSTIGAVVVALAVKADDYRIRRARRRSV